MRHVLHNLWLILTLGCERAEVIRIKASYGEQTSSEQVAERLHRAICGPCRQAARQHSTMNQVLQHRQNDDVPRI